MVTLINRKSIPALVAMAALFAAAPRVAQSQGVLEQMQDEVSAIALRTKSAVVTISEKGNYDYRVNAIYETLDEAKKRAADAKKSFSALGRDYFNLDYAETGGRAALAALLKKYAESHPQVLTQKEKNKTLKKRLDDLKAKLDAAKSSLNDAPQIKGYRLFRKADSSGGSSNAIDVYSAAWQAVGAKTGSGFSIGGGYVVTTADVLDGMTDPIVTTDSGVQVRAKILGVDKDLNVGLVQLLAKVDLPALTLGDSARVAVGHFAISVGEQSGQANSVALMLVGGLRTDGVSSGGHFYPNLIQIAGTVGAGISGAPLVNARGEVIGVMAGVPAAPLSGLDYNAARQVNDGQLEWNVGLRTMGTRAWSLPNQNYYTYSTTPVAPAGKDNPYIVSPALPPGEHLDTLPKKDNAGKTSVPVLGDIPLIRQLFTREKVPNTAVELRNAFVNTVASPVTSAGFAVPINAIKPILEELKSGKPVAKGWIGISPKDEATTTENANVVFVNRRVVAEGVYPDSPAFIGGLLPGDVILRLNATQILTANDVREVSQGLRPGDSLTVVYRRVSGPERQLTLTITARPAAVKAPLTLPSK